ncbi:30S ribosomal protein S8 [Pseudenhygromyxa sp. WMMC2535]|uniref:30S ribosomal protein S8 n=1 Tax=Pseudenhygromyxa sp. WMMC2535 TaxID=2712867 RepID=UPI001551C0CF|nr:30S ribosomal protein S8 [Pseudenhygromyxa sp. WMMC2535]NVB36809.1 30S ribosomal protein S8 [Pseudenhygromyxa sp. WMMC2535]
MSMTDPIADMLTRIRNALRAGHRSVVIPGSKTKRRIAEILQQEGYIDGFEWFEDQRQGKLDIQLRWVGDQPAIEGIARVSKPGQRRYAQSKEIPQVRNGLGIMVISTSRGMMTDRAARKAGVGGELICSVW